MHFSLIKVSNLIRCDHKGNVVEGEYPVNTAAYIIHSRVHAARPDAVAARHSHSTYGRAFSTLGRPLAPITQDACAFYNDHAIYEDFGGLVADLDEGQRIANALGKHKAAILQSHGLITVGGTVDEAVWWFITMERSCQVQLLAEATLRNGEALKLISPQAAAHTYAINGNAFAGWFQFQPLYARIVKEAPRPAGLRAAAPLSGNGASLSRLAEGAFRRRLPDGGRSAGPSGRGRQSQGPSSPRSRVPEPGEPECR